METTKKPRRGCLPDAGKNQNQKNQQHCSTVLICDATEEFRAACSERGGRLPASPDIGKISRCEAIDGRRGNRDFAYVLYLDGFPAGGFQNFRDGGGWQRWRFQGNVKLSPAELKSIRDAQQRYDARRKLDAAAKAAACSVGRTVFNYYAVITAAEKRLAYNPDDEQALFWMSIAYKKIPGLEHIHDFLLSKSVDDKATALRFMGRRAE